MSDKLLRKVLSVVEEFRKLDAEMPTQTVATFLAIALKPGITIKDIEKELGIAMSSASRNVAILSDRPSRQPRAGKPGHGLVEYRVDPNDYRRRELHLTRTGQRVLNHVLTIMKD